MSIFGSISWKNFPLNLISKDQVENRFFVRVSESEKELAAELFEDAEEVSAADITDENLIKL